METIVSAEVYHTLSPAPSPDREILPVAIELARQTSASFLAPPLKNRLSLAIQP
jgi:hypothetical protein